MYYQGEHQRIFVSVAYFTTYECKYAKGRYHNMSIPKGRTSYFGRFEEPEKYRTIPQKGLRVRLLAEAVSIGYEHCWDMNTSPFDGTMYMAPSDELLGRGAHTRLVAYDHLKDELKVCIKLEDLVLPSPRHMPHSKLHTSINFLPDGTIIATTHTTSGPANHPSWMPMAYLNHPWEGYPGSNIIHYDPKTGKSENWGIPVPRESIYGSCYHAKNNCLYMIGFLRGHVYCYSLDTKTVKDLGKAAEIFNYRLHLAPDGNIYSMTKSGYLYRINTEKDVLEDMNWHLPADPDNYINNTWYRYMCDAVNTDDRHFVFTANSIPYMYEFDCETLTVRNLGRRSPFDYTSDFHVNCVHLDEFAIDKYGCLWYTLTRAFLPSVVKEDFYHYPEPLFLMRWDIRNGKDAECVGIVDTPDYKIPNAHCVRADPVNDILYLVANDYTPKDENAGKPRGLGILAIDLKEFRPAVDAGEQGPRYEFEITPYTEEEIEAALNCKKGYAGEEVSEENPTTIFMPDEVTPIRLWRAVPHTNIEGSKVIGLAYEADGTLYGTSGKDGIAEYAFKIVPRPHFTYASKEEAEQSEEYMVTASIANGYYDVKTWTDADGNFCVEAPSCYAFKVEWLKPIDEVCPERRAWMEANLLPKKPDIDPALKLPETNGRRYLARATAAAEWNNGRKAVGTADAMFAIADGDKVHAYGNCAAFGDVRCMCTNADKTVLYGVAGYEAGECSMFRFDDEEGLRQIGFVGYNVPGFMDGPTAANQLSSIVLSPDEKYIAVGCDDRLGSVHIFALGGK